MVVQHLQEVNVSLLIQQLITYTLGTIIIGTGSHRYVFFVHRQLNAAPLTFPNGQSRPKFDMESFQKKTNISNPIGIVTPSIAFIRSVPLIDSL
jgi:hypothetical protein